jgi:hypothetical protein
MRREFIGLGFAFGQRPPLGGLGFGLLEPVQEIHGLLRVGGGAENRALIVLEHRKPHGDVGGMVVPHFRRQAKVGAQERGSQLGHQFLAGIALVAPALAAKVALQRCRVACPVCALVGQSRVEALGIPERFDRRMAASIAYLGG